MNIVTAQNPQNTRIRPATGQIPPEIPRERPRKRNDAHQTSQKSRPSPPINIKTIAVTTHEHRHRPNPPEHPVSPGNGPNTAPDPPGTTPKMKRCSPMVTEIPTMTTHEHQN